MKNISSKQRLIWKRTRNVLVGFFSFFTLNLLFVFLSSTLFRDQPRMMILAVSIITLVEAGLLCYLLIRGKCWFVFGGFLAWFLYYVTPEIAGLFLIQLPTVSIPAVILIALTITMLTFILEALRTKESDRKKQQFLS